MRNERQRKLPLFELSVSWQRLPEQVRQQALDVLTNLYLEIVSVPNQRENAETKEEINESNH